MKHKLCVTFWVVLVLSTCAFGQTGPSAGFITSTQCVSISATNLATGGYGVSGTWTGTLQAYGIVGQGTPQSLGTQTGNGSFTVSISGYNLFEVCGNTVATGAAFVQLTTSAVGGGGGGLPTGLSFTAPTLTVSQSGSGNGQVALSGNTSGTCTFTDNATSTSVASSCPLTAPASSTAALYGNASDGSGMGAALSNVYFYTGATQQVQFASNGAFFKQPVCDFSTGNNCLTFASGLISMTGSATPLFYANNTCRITADVSLTVNTANSFCSFTLPASAKAWGFSCNILWAITAGTGTNNFALGVNPSQTPTGTTNAIATIITATTGTQTNGSAAISASGADTILTGATYTPAATVLPATISGTVLASATAGTFAIQATANGTTATAAVKAGSSCQIF